MIDLTEQQEQEMIEKAKAGDPEANYRMSLWALEQAMAEPDEERWNRLAAKCLVRSAEAGYAPAKEKMEELLAQTAEAQPAEPTPARPEPAPVPPARKAAEPSEASAPVQRKSAAAVFASLGAKVKGAFSGLRAKGGNARAASPDGKKAGLFNFNQWDDAKWKKMQLVCIIICVLLAVLILVMVLSGRSKKNSAAEAEIVIPPAAVAATPVPSTPTPTPVDYPADDVKAEIAAADLTVFPEEADFVTEVTTRTVTTNGGPLNMRKGTNSDAEWISSISSGTKLDVYAFRNGWALVKVGGTWGWCSNDYLK
ncbi:MAG: SH3 domain-containing protein [Oscillospiraceae bacterium]